MAVLEGRAWADVSDSDESVDILCSSTLPRYEACGRPPDAASVELYRKELMGYLEAIEVYRSIQGWEKMPSVVTAVARLVAPAPVQQRVKTGAFVFKGGRGVGAHHPQRTLAGRRVELEHCGVDHWSW